MDGERFGSYCRERGIDCVKVTPTHLQALLGEEGGAECIPEKCLVFGGEALWPELVARVKSLRPGMPDLQPLRADRVHGGSALR